MEIKKEDLQRTIEDVALIRRSIAGVDREDGKNWGWSPVTARVNIFLQLSALAMAFSLLVSEFLYNHALTVDFFRSIGNNSYKFLYIWQTGLGLSVFLSVIYFIAYIASSRNSQGYSEYIAKNFTYLKNFSFLSDMFIKFTVFSLLIIADRPYWTFPLFFLFTADYLFQGRLFTLPTNLSLVLGVVYSVFAFIQFFTGSWFIAWPLLGFVSVTLLSLMYSYSQRKLIKTQILCGEEDEA